ncbi:FAD-dependent oxidoreductase [uncultured Ruminococcus sp.]|uniref:FAD-dependent oxidoreductase n=1 Tax=uncultured Ruminococcus sp. TaxID=165186 RepID=UPI002930BA48|nr:FAD-dependent oxidoreductase [uncultured Ruminococcus sp.]
MKSIWQDTARLPRFPQLKKDIRTDVMIIGGGIAGILTAYFLHQAGVKYVLVEKNTICSGTTQNTTAKITYQHGLIYHQILKSYGTHAVQQYLNANKRAFEQYATLCRSIDCDYEEKDNYVYSTNDRKKLDDEMEALHRIGYRAELCENPIIPIKTMGAVKFSRQAQFHPLKFLSAVAKGLNIYEHTFVREMIGNMAITDHATIQANHVIVTTHFPFINKHGSYFFKLYQHRSYVLGLRNAQDVEGMYVDECRTGLSFRNRGDLLLLGGGGHRTGHKGGNWNELREFAKKVYPHSTEQYRWAAQDCMSLDDIPYIGRYSKSTRDFYVASGFNKWGMTGAMTAAMILTDTILGKHNDCADVFDPSRSILKPQLLVNGLEATKNLLTISKKRCPHLGCALKWNSAERSWDCPCHGSRFDKHGKVLDNPANGDLPS